MQKIEKAPMRIKKDSLEGQESTKSSRKLSQISELFDDQESLKDLDQSQLAYEVDCYFPVAQGKEGGLFYGFTKIYPGKVGDEYFMTKGHFHEKLDTGEFYWAIEGRGALVFMDQDRKVKVEEMTPGSLHYIPGKIAHRTVNIGDEPLTFGACWPSDAGHDYATIMQEGFAARIKEVDGEPTVVEVG